MSEDIKVVSKDVAHWETVLEGLEKEQRSLRTSVIFNETLLEKAKDELEKAKQ